jgi:hypothetical protein
MNISTLPLAPHVINPSLLLRFRLLSCGTLAVRQPLDPTLRSPLDSNLPSTRLNADLHDSSHSKDQLWFWALLLAILADPCGAPFFLVEPFVGGCEKMCIRLERTFGQTAWTLSGA